MEINAYTLNSFAKTMEGGNPAGVVLNADSLSESDMKKVAASLGFSETKINNLGNFQLERFLI